MVVAASVEYYPDVGGMRLVADADEEDYVDYAAGRGCAKSVAVATAGPGDDGLRDGMMRPWTFYVGPA